MKDIPPTGEEHEKESINGLRFDGRHGSPGAIPHHQRAAALAAGAEPVQSDHEIEYTLPTAAVVSLAVYEATGRRVRSMTLGAQSEGTHAAAWDGRSDANVVLPSGLYIYRIAAGDLEESGRLIIVR